MLASPITWAVSPTFFVRPCTITKSLIEFIASGEGEFVVRVNRDGLLTSLLFDFAEGVRDDHLFLNAVLAAVIVDNRFRGLWIA
jgi:hypothetical protein